MRGAAGPSWIITAPLQSGLLRESLRRTGKLWATGPRRRHATKSLKVFLDLARK